MELLSNETQVTAATPPTFLFHTTDDAAVPVENSILFYEALRKGRVHAELHIFERGPHGVGLAAQDATLSIWRRFWRTGCAGAACSIARPPARNRDGRMLKKVAIRWLNPRAAI